MLGKLHQPGTKLYSGLNRGNLRMMQTEIRRVFRVAARHKHTPIPLKTRKGKKVASIVYIPQFGFYMIGPEGCIDLHGIFN